MTSANKTPSSATWPPNTAAPDELQDAFQQAHSGVQWLARMVNSFCLPASDGSHLHMSWGEDRAVIETTHIVDATAVQMRLPEMALQFVEQGAPTLHPVELDDNSPAQIEAWTLIELLHRGIDRDAYSKDLPYDVSHLLGGDAHNYETLDRERAFQDMTDWLVLAGDLLRTVAAEASANGLGEPSDVRFSPEHFSLFVRLHPNNGRPAVGSYVELGFCAGNTADMGPHFYSALARNGKAKRLSIAEIGEKALSREDVAGFFAVPAQIDQLNGG